MHRTTQNKQYIEQHKNFGRVWAVPHLCGFYPGIWLTTEEKARKNLSQGSRRVPAGTMKIHKHTIRIHRYTYSLKLKAKCQRSLDYKEYIRRCLASCVLNIKTVKCKSSAVCLIHWGLRGEFLLFTVFQLLWLFINGIMDM
jgi:hypothetical protein